MEGSYRRAHPAIVQLHLIREAEEAMAAVASLEPPPPPNNLNSLNSLTNSQNHPNGTGMNNNSLNSVGSGARGMQLLLDWEPRLELTPPALATREPILVWRCRLTLQDPS